MNNSTILTNTNGKCNYCHVDLEKAEIPIILIITLVFNIIAVVVLFKIRQSSEKINHYLVTTVAVNDLFSTSLFTLMWIGGLIKCGCMMDFNSCAVLGWLGTTSVIWSAWIVSIMSVTRYMATVRPLVYRSHVTASKVHVAIYGTLAFTLIQLMFPFFGVTSPYLYYEDNFICAYNFSPGDGGSAHRSFLGFLTMEGLLTSIASMYFNATIVYKLRKKTSINRKENQYNGNGQPQKNTKIAFANVTVVVSVVFCICYVPFLVRLLYDVTVTNVKSQDGMYHSVTMSLLFLAPLLNPVVYVVCNKRYRLYITSAVGKLCTKLHLKRSNRIHIEVQNSETALPTVSSTV